MIEIGAKLEYLTNHLNQGLVGRSDVVNTALLGLLAGENTLLVGPPGTAKSQLARRISHALASEGDYDYFEYLLTKFSTPEELFGPLSLSELKQDRFCRKTDGYLPSVQVAFLDEIFKASSSILNALLTILNERTYHNGTAIVSAPLKTVIAASNELPEQSELQALYDRFLLRHYVDYLDGGDTARLFDVPAMPVIPLEYQLTAQDLATIKDEARYVSCPEPVQQLILTIWQNHKKAFADDAGESLSDRRLVKVINLLKVSAASNGRASVDYSDVLLLKDCLWNKPENKDKVTELVTNALKGQTNTNGSKTTTNKTASGGGTIKGYQGSGTQDDPFLIETIDHLKGLERPEIGRQGYHFLQVADIDCSSLSSDGWFDIEDFYGYYDGGYHLLSCGGEESRPIFMSLVKGEVKDLSLEIVYLAHSIDANDEPFLVSGCHANFILAVEINNAIIRKCFADSLAINLVENTIIDECKVDDGLILEDSFGNNITNCYVGGMSVRDDRFGFIASYAEHSVISNCYVQGNVKGSSSEVGYCCGIIGCCDEDNTVQTCAVGVISFDNDIDVRGRVAYLASDTTSLKNNISISSNTFGGDDKRSNGQDGKSIDPDLFNQYYFETSLGWDFDTVWQWNDLGGHPELQCFCKPRPTPKQATATPQALAGGADTITQQLNSNLWVRQ